MPIATITTPTIDMGAVLPQPWLIKPDWLEAMAKADPQALINTVANTGANTVPKIVFGQVGEPMPQTDLVRVRNGVAVIHIQGVVRRYGTWWSSFSIDRLARDFRRVVEDSAIKAILPYFDTPGGQANGVHEMADMIYQARAIKPIKAYVSGLGASAGYWMASACQEIVIDKTAELGCIGAYVVHMDWSKFDEKMGLKEIVIVSSQSPKKVPNPATDEGYQQILNQLNALTDVFVEDVARNRGVSVDTVLSDFGQGDVLMGANAVGVGLADRLGSFEELLEELSSDTPKGGIYMPSMNSETPLTVDMVESEYPEIAEAIRKKGHEAGMTEGLTQGKEEGRIEERVRIQGIEWVAVPGHEALINKMKFEEPCSAEQAAVKILHAEKSIRAGYLKDVEADAKELEGLAPSQDEAGGEAQAAERKDVAESMANGANELRKKQ